MFRRDKHTKSEVGEGRGDKTTGAKREHTSERSREE